MQIVKTIKNFTKFVFILALVLVAHSVLAADIGEVNTFNVEKDFDAGSRNQISAVLISASSKVYFYIEKPWWDAQSQSKKDEILSDLGDLGQEFDNRIYPILTSIFGSEWKPGVDNDSKITVFFEAMNSSEGGYFREADEYIKLQIPTSNEREMLYLSLDKISDQNLKVILAHELVHLITFNQKNIKFGIEDDVWLNEARADYSSTILGYDDNYGGSNLQQRVRDFIEGPSDSVTDWRGTKYDYASVSLLMRYIVDHYGVNILFDSLKSQYSGIESINYALVKVGFKKDFGGIFTDWTIASVLNDCSANQHYCYLNSNLKNFRLAPSLNFLPLTGNVSLSVTNSIKPWAGSWLKFIGGNGDLELGFSGLKGLNFKVPYIVTDSVGTSAVKLFELDQNQQGQINVEKFGTDYKSLIILPSLQSNTSYTSGQEFTYPYNYTVKIIAAEQSNNQDIIQQLLNQIEDLKQQIANLESQLNGSSSASCDSFNSNLYFGMSNNNNVKCLQQFLKDQGVGIYPEGFITGYFGNLTRAAVIRFQEKFALEVLTPLGLASGTGYVGPNTRSKINQINGSI